MKPYYYLSSFSSSSSSSVPSLCNLVCFLHFAHLVTLTVFQVLSGRWGQWLQHGPALKHSLGSVRARPEATTGPQVGGALGGLGLQAMMLLLILSLLSVSRQHFQQLSFTLKKLRYNCHIILHQLQVYNLNDLIFMYNEIITTVKSSRHPSPCSYTLLFLVMRTRKTDSVRNLQTHTTVLLTTVAMPRVTPQDNFFHGSRFESLDHLHPLTLKGNHSALEIVPSLC